MTESHVLVVKAKPMSRDDNHAIKQLAYRMFVEIRKRTDRVGDCRIAVQSDEHVAELLELFRSCVRKPEDPNLGVASTCRLHDV